MTVFSWLQALVQAGQESIPHIPDSVSQPAVVTLILAAFKFWDNKKGNKRDPILHEIRDDLRVVKWHVQGPNGDGGLLKDVDKLTTDIEQIRRHLPADDGPIIKR